MGQYLTRVKKTRLTLNQADELRLIAAIPGAIICMYLYEIYKREYRPIGPEEKMPVQSWDKYVKERTSQGKDI